MNLPNKLTVFRVILVFVILIISLINMQGTILGIPINMFIIDIIFIIASITDKLDGYIARSTNQITTFGKFLDPLADKILVLTAMVMLVEMDKIPAWIPSIVLAREFIVSGYRLIAVEKGGKVIAASIWGKLKTVTQMIAIILLFIDKFNFFDFTRATTDIKVAMESSWMIYMNQGSIIFNAITSICLLISVIATVFSGYEYLKDGKELFKD